MYLYENKLRIVVFVLLLRKRGTKRKKKTDCEEKKKTKNAIYGDPCGTLRSSCDILVKCFFSFYFLYA
ncbi:hypothetical protein PGB90_010110 [Kerria lacca]